MLDTEISSRQKFLDLTHKDANLSTIQKLLIKKGKNEGENKKKLKNQEDFNLEKREPKLPFSD